MTYKIKGRTKIKIILVRQVFFYNKKIFNLVGVDSLMVLTVCVLIFIAIIFLRDRLLF